LLEVLERLGAALVSAGELPSQRQETLDQCVAIAASPRRPKRFEAVCVAEVSP
jgi:hypothetical protein